MSGFLCPYCGKAHGGDADFICSERWQATGEYRGIEPPRKMIAADIGLCEPHVVWPLERMGAVFRLITGDFVGDTWGENRVWWGGRADLGGWR